MIVGSYCLRLYCDSEFHPVTYFQCPDEIDASDKREAFNIAKSCGWLIKKDKAYCRDCWTQEKRKNRIKRKEK